MAVTRYSSKVDLANLNSSHSLAVLSVRPGSRVLDLGAADGSVARALRDRGCVVWGMEQDARAATDAEKVCERVIVGDLESAEVWTALEGQTFDVILALDVLEHLRDPSPALSRACRSLAPDGLVIVSLPNITHAAVRASLLAGRFKYTDLGLLDRTHLRFFDRDSAEQLLLQAGLQIVDRLSVRRAIDETEIPIDRDAIASDVLEIIERQPDATTYQFVLTGRPRAAVPPPLPGTMLAEELQRENEQLRAVVADGKAYAEHLTRELETLRGAVQDHEWWQRTAVGKMVRLEDTAQQLRDQVSRLDGLPADQDQVGSLESERASLLEVQQRLREELERLASEKALLVQAHEQRVVELERQRTDERATGVELLAELRAELDRRMTELNQRHLELRHAKADLGVKEAYIHKLRGEVFHLDARVKALEAYSQSAAFRLVNGVIRRAKGSPALYRVLQSMARRLAGPRQ